MASHSYVLSRLYPRPINWTGMNRSSSYYRTKRGLWAFCNTSVVAFYDEERHTLFYPVKVGWGSTERRAKDLFIQECSFAERIEPPPVNRYANRFRTLKPMIAKLDIEQFRNMVYREFPKKHFWDDGVVLKHEVLRDAY